MRPDTTRPPRRAGLLLWAGAALLAAFAGLAVFVHLSTRPRYASDAQLLAELAEVTFDDDLAPAPDWPQWRGPHRDGTTRADAFPEKWPDRGPKRLWTVKGGDGFSSLAVAGGRAYSMVATEDEQEAVVCLSLTNGKELWRRAYSPARTFQYGGPRATPTLVGDRLYTVSSAGVLMCLKTGEKGAVAWERDLTKEPGGQAPHWGYAFSPLVEGDLVFAVPGGSRGRALAAFHKDTGELAWASQDGSAGYSSPVAATIGGRRHVIFLTGRTLFGVTPDEGKLLWSFEWKDRHEVNAATPLVIHGRDRKGDRVSYVFISSGYGQGCALLKIEPARGGFQARPVYVNNELCIHFASPVRYKDHLYALDETRDLTCLNIKTGEVAWRFDHGGEGTSSIRRRKFRKGSLLRVNDKLIVYGDTAKLALVACDPKEYRELSASLAFSGGQHLWAAPAYAGGKLLVRDRKQVACFDLRAPGRKP